MPTGSEQSKINITVEKFQQLKKLQEAKVKELAAKERDVVVAKEALLEVVNELKEKGIESTEQLSKKIASLQEELDKGLRTINDKLKGVIHEN